MKLSPKRTGDILRTDFMSFHQDSHAQINDSTISMFLKSLSMYLATTKPNGLHPERKAESWLAETIHWLLYGSLVIVPLTGWIHHAASTGFAPIWWPFGQNLPFVAKSESTSELFAGFHIIFPIDS